MPFFARALVSVLALWHLVGQAAAQGLEPPVEAPTVTRGVVCLNGLWRFIPGVPEAENAPAEQWGLMPVPGSWKSCARLPGLAQRGAGPFFDTPLETLARGWYEREVTVPAEWAGRSILVRLDRVSTDAVVYANGVECGTVEWPEGEVDITHAVTPGERATLRVLVIAAQTAAEVAVYMGIGQNTMAPANLATRGLIGDVLLLSRPAGAYITDVFVQTSVRNWRLTVDVELADVRQAGPVEVTASVLDERGSEERRFVAEAEATGAPTQVLSLSWDWPNPRLWDVRQPNLYHLVLSIRGAGIDDAYAVRFGFREFWIEGRRFMLNGTEIRLRPALVNDQWNDAAWVPEAIEAMIDGYMWAGYNIGEHWPWDHDERGQDVFRTLWAEKADEKGFLLAGCAMSAARNINGPSWEFIWEEPGNKQRWEERMSAELAQYRNHPSIVMWATTPNFFGRYQDQDPMVIGRRGWHAHGVRERAGLEAVAAIKRHDPTRPVFTHHGADIGDIHTCNMYLCLIPLQEREEWLSEYMASAELPFLPIEMGTPLHTTFMRGRNGFGEAVISEPLMTEFCAMYLGEQAYRTEPEAYRRQIVDSFQGGQRYQNWQGRWELEQAPAFQALQELFIRNTWRSWRTWGMEAGMVPWHSAHGWNPGAPGAPAAGPALEVTFVPGRRGPYFPTVAPSIAHYLRPESGTGPFPAGRALIESNSETLAWIAGRPEAFTEKSHHFVPGESVVKQVVLLNDTRAEQPFAWRVEVTLAGQRVLTRNGTGTLGPAQTLRVPFEFTVPEVATRTDGEIRLAAEIGGRGHADRFPFRAIPPLEPFLGGQHPVLAYDPEGATVAKLAELGIDTEVWDGAFRAGAVLVVGRNALCRSDPMPGSVADFVKAGGRVILMGQDPEWLRQGMGMRVARFVGRRFFVVPSMADHPAVAGLDSEDLRDWRGSGTAVAEAWGGYSELPDRDPPYGWHWGNRGSVSSAAIEKPHHSGWRPIIEGEFDLAYSPLMELRLGRGLVIWCTLDIEGRTESDPVGDRVLRNLVQYAGRAAVVPAADQTVYLGDEGGASLLRRVGLRFEPASALPAGGLAVVGPGARCSDEELRGFVAAGGKALILPRGEGAHPLGFVMARGSSHGSLDVPRWPECRGLSASDLRLRADVELALVTEAPAGGEVAAGGLLGRVARGDGVCIALAVTPDMLMPKQRTYLRYSSWRVTRTLTQILANLGGSFAMDDRSLDFGWNAVLAPVTLAGEWLCKVEQRVRDSRGPDDRPADPGNLGEAQGFASSDLDTADWERRKVPAMWESYGPDWEFEGAVWFRRDVSIRPEWQGEDLYLELGRVDDHDQTYFNGTLIGAGDGWNVRRVYRVPSELVRAGTNTIAVRVFDNYGGGGFGGPAEAMRIGRIAVREPAGEELLSNTGFSAGLNGWNLGALDPARAEAAVSDDVPAELLGGRSACISVTEPSGTSWHVSFTQPGHGVEAGTTYEYRFFAKAREPASITASVERDHPPHGSAGLWVRVALTPEWQEFAFVFTPTESDDQVRVGFQEMALRSNTYWIAAPSLTVKPASEAEADDASAAATVGFYSRDHRDDFELGDDPYRYFRW